MRHFKATQYSLFAMKNKNIFGGSLLKKSNPKEKRPVSTKHAMHLVLRSSHAKGSQNFLIKKNSQKIALILKQQANRWGIRLYRFENVGNHLHLLLRTQHRRQLIGFLRSISGIIARHILKTERGSGKSLQFWDARPFSRIVTWGSAYKRLQTYFDKNKLQALGFNLNLLVQSLKQLNPETG